MRNSEVTKVLFLTSGLITLFAFYFGMHFEGYEGFINFVSKCIIIDDTQGFNTNNVFFLIFNIIVYIQKKNPHIPVYGIFLIIASLIPLLIFNIIYINRFRQHVWYAKVFILVVFFLIYFDSLINLHSTRIAFFLCGSYYLAAYNFQFSYNKLIVSLGFFLFILGCLIRIEVGFLVSVIAIAVIFIQKMQIKKSFVIIPFILSTTLMLILNYLISQDDPYRKSTLNHEIEYFDKYNTTDIKPHLFIPFFVNDVFYGRNKTSDIKPHRSKQLAVRFFIEDRENISIEDYENEVLYKNLNYYFNNPNLKYIIALKVRDFLEFIINYWNLHLIVLTNIILCFFLYKEKKIRFLLSLILFISVPFLLLLRHDFEPKNYAPYIELLTILSFFVIFNKLNRDYILLYCIFAFFISAFSLKNFKNDSEVYVRENSIFKSIDAGLKKIHNEGKTPLISNFLGLRMFSSRLFEKYDTDVYFLDCFTFSYIEMVRAKHRDIFTNQTSLKSRLTDVVNNDKLLFVSTDYYNNILKSYLESQISTSIDFKNIDIIYEELKTYEVSITNTLQ